MTTLKELKKEYQEAIKEEKEIIVIDNKEILTNYLKYVIEYLKMRGIKDKDEIKLG